MPPPLTATEVLPGADRPCPLFTPLNHGPAGDPQTKCTEDVTDLQSHGSSSRSKFENFTCTFHSSSRAELSVTHISSRFVSQRNVDWIEIYWASSAWSHLQTTPLGSVSPLGGQAARLERPRYLHHTVTVLWYHFSCYGCILWNLRMCHLVSSLVEGSIEKRIALSKRIIGCNHGYWNGIKLLSPYGVDVHRGPTKIVQLLLSRFCAPLYNFTGWIDKLTHTIQGMCDRKEAVKWYIYIYKVKCSKLCTINYHSNIHLVPIQAIYQIKIVCYKNVMINEVRLQLITVSSRSN